MHSNKAVPKENLMFEAILKNYIEPAPSDYDSYYYDINGGVKDLTFLPPFLKEYVEYPEYMSGTHKFLPLIYSFAKKAERAIELGVFTGCTTVPLALGLRENNGILFSVDSDLKHPSLKEKVEKHDLMNNVVFIEMNDLEFEIEYLLNSIDLIYIDTAHTYEHTLRELFHYDKYLKSGGVFLLHDIVVGDAWCSKEAEDIGYENLLEVMDLVRNNSKNLHASKFPALIPKVNALRSPVYLAVETFLFFRPKYKFFKNLDFGGLGIIWKLD